MSAAQFAPEDPTNTEWDAIVVGTGMGGATIGYELSRLGCRVLFVEKGLLRHGDENARTRVIEEPTTPEERLECGLWPTRFTGDTSFGRMEFFSALGCGSGGSTSLYAAALERFFPEDFAPRRHFPQALDSTLPERWPITYDDLEPFYTQAERMFGVRGTPDPLHRGDVSHLREAPALSARDRHFADSFTKLGLHPYRVHAAYEFAPGCDGCIGGFCKQQCKRDAGWVCLLPALQQFGARMLDRCEVLRLEASATSVTGVLCRHRDREITLRGKVVVLAAGAYSSPVLLLNSRSAHWPEGLANTSGLVGRNLMFHATDFFAVAPLQPASGEGPQKALALNDFYLDAGEKLGTCQSLGVETNIGQIMMYIRSSAQRETKWWRRLARAEPRWWGRLTSPVIRLVAGAAYHVFNFKHAAVWASIIEDLPYADNRVVADASVAGGIRFEYRYRDELRRRAQLLRKHLAKALQPHRTIFLSSDNNLNYGHVCGTCRFGLDPRDSVLDASNRAHGVDNLYVVDASFFPSSGGTNPSLTIAANALRVAQIIGRQVLGQSSAELSAQGSNIGA